MTWELSTAVMSGIIALGTFLYTLIGLRHKAETDYVSRIDKRLGDYVKRLEECERSRYELRDQLIGLKSFQVSHSECDLDRERLRTTIKALEIEIGELLKKGRL